MLWGCTMLVKASHAHALNMDLMGCSHKYVPLSLFNLSGLFFNTFFNFFLRTPALRPQQVFSPPLRFGGSQGGFMLLCAAAQTHTLFSHLQLISSLPCNLNFSYKPL